MSTRNYNTKREKSRGRVIRFLQKEPKRFTELEKETGLSPAGLNEALKVMKEKKEIKLVLVEGKPRYKLTKNGKISLENFQTLSFDVDEIRARGGKHHRDYSTLYNTIVASGLPWGIESDLTLDNEVKDLKLLQPKDVIEIEELVFKKINNNLKKKKLKKVQFGKMVLGFSIDYNELVKSIEGKSLAYINHMSEGEVRLLGKIDGSPDSLTEKEGKRLVVLRRKTYEKIKKLDY